MTKREMLTKREGLGLIVLAAFLVLGVAPIIALLGISFGTVVSAFIGGLSGVLAVIVLKRMRAKKKP